MLVEHAITVDSAVIVAGAPASISTSRAMLLHVRFGTTLPQIAKSGTTPPARCSIACATGTDRPIASSLDNEPSTLANGVRTPAASQMSGWVEWAMLTLLDQDDPILDADAGRTCAWRKRRPGCLLRGAAGPEWATAAQLSRDRQGVASGKRGAIRVDLGGGRIIKKKKKPKE